MRGALALAVVAAACGGGGDRNPPYAVGAYLGTGSHFAGADRSGCTYEADPAVAEITENKVIAKLVGEGTVTKVCGSEKTTIEVKRPTAAKISGPATLKVGTQTNEQYHARVYAGDRELAGAHTAEPAWSLGADCDGVATFAPVMGAQDTGRDRTRSLVVTKPGACTITATLLGVTGQRTITIE